MDRLRSLQVFIAVANARSFTTAAHNLGMSRASVTKHVAALEQSLGARVLNRSPQHVAPTEVGNYLLEHGTPLLQAFAELEAGVKTSTIACQGLLRIGATSSFAARRLTAAIAGFTKKHPSISVSFTCIEDTRIDLLREGLDVVVGLQTAFKDSNYVSRLLQRLPQVLVAAPAYLDRYGRPATLDALGTHRCLVHSAKEPSGLWEFRRGTKTVQAHVKGSLCSNAQEVLYAATLAGEGISLQPLAAAEEDLAAGRLEVVLPASNPAPLEMRAIYWQRRYLPARIRLFVDEITAWMQREDSLTRIGRTSPRGREEPGPDPAEPFGGLAGKVRARQRPATRPLN
jgi:DNA-binding transcriptional LysR family regulator